MNKKLKVAVLMGGPSSEYDISILSGKNVVENLDKKSFEVVPIVIPKEADSNWIKKLNGIDIVFIALHGPFGEDGTVQKQLDELNIPYTGSNANASLVGLDKLAFRKLMNSFNIKIPKYLQLKKGESTEEVSKVLGRPPYFVKPHNQGSSIGSSLVKNINSLSQTLDKAYEFSDIALVDEYINGTEVTCGILGNTVLPLAEIIPKNDFFDFESKYSENGTKEIIPARLNNELTKKIQKIALLVYRSVGCRGFARVDFIIRDGTDPVVLEINTIPGLTSVSILPKQAQAVGISYDKLLTRIINLALDYNGKQ